MGSLEMHSPFPDEPVELIFLGTGTSSSLPHVDCLTAPPDAKPCRTCLSTLRPEGKKNIRVSICVPYSTFRADDLRRTQRNTSAALRVRGSDGEKR